MKIEMGESLFYSWLRHVKECQIVQTNWKVSSQWTLIHEGELTAIKEKTDEFFHNKHGYDIYKKNASLTQIIQQGESDAIGISFQNGITKTYAVDVAFHEAGLNYGSKEVTVMKIINKCIRTAMCLYGYMDIRNAEIIFASPKINASILDEAKVCVEKAQQLMLNMGYKFVFRIISNDDFKELVLDPILLASDGIADTNELFVRSYQMLQMFEGKKPTGSKSIPDTPAMSAAAGKELKVGKLARIMIPKLMQEGNVSENEIAQMLTREYSKQAFDLQYPALAKVDSDYDRVRYYATPFKVGTAEYVLCSQWFETSANNDRPYLEKWISEHESGH